MGLFEFKKPKWRHKDPVVRLASIENIDPGETEILACLAREDQDQEVRRAAINRLADLTALGQLAKEADPGDLPVIAARKDTILFDQIATCQDPEEWRERLDKITSPEVLAKLAVNAGQPEVRLAAVNKIEDQALLAEIVRQNCGKKPAMAAMEKISDEALLADLSESAASKTTRRLAAEKTAEIELRRNPPDHKEIIAQKLTTLTAEAAQLLSSLDIDAAALRLAAIKQEWQALDSANTHPAYGAFSRICNDFEDHHKEILDRRRMSRKEAARHEQAMTRLNEICGIIERLSCSTDIDAEAVKERAMSEWAMLVNDPNGGLIVPSASLTKRFTDACRAFDTNREKIDLEREHVKVIGKICSETQELIANKDLRKAAAGLAEIKKNVARLEFKYFRQTVIEKLVSDVAVDLDKAEQEVRTQNLSRRQEICAELEELGHSEKYSHIERQLQLLQQEWQKLTKLEDAEGKELEQRFRKIVADLVEKLKTLEHEQDWELWANLHLKEKLTQGVVALDLEENLATVVNVIKQSQAEWKQIGPVPHERSQEIWDAFQSACNRNFERARPYLEELKTRRVEAMDRRREICTLAAELAESTDWQKTTLAIKELQEEWKTLLHGARREEQKLYQQFREACDRFFERRQEHYKHKDIEWRQNLIDKGKLCEEAEQLAATPQTDYAKQFKRLQSDWKKIGPVPRKNKDAIWKRFRAACDNYFHWLAAEQRQNLQRKEELCEMAEKLVAEPTAEDKQQEIATRLTELQQQWKEIGPVPPGRSEAVWQRFREPCDLFFTARQKQYEKEEEQRRINQGRKEEILARAEELASRSKDKETTAQLQQLQKEWFETGPAPREINKELNDRFKALCDAYFEDRRQYFTDLHTQQLDNQKKKEILCLRLENIIGLSSGSGAGKHGKALSLAEELKQAMEDNFMLAGRRNEQKDIREEVKRIEQDWEKIGPVPPRQIRPITERYKKALAAYFKSQRSRKK